jgi:hypothetical protein
LLRAVQFALQNIVVKSICGFGLKFSRPAAICTLQGSFDAIGGLVFRTHTVDYVLPFTLNRGFELRDARLYI